MSNSCKPATPQTRAITIYVKGGNHFDVHEGECYSDHLCWDEMLGQIASMTHPRIAEPRYSMLTPEGWDERDQRMRFRSAARRRRNEAKLCRSEPTQLGVLQLMVRWHGLRHLDTDELLPPEQQPDDVRMAMEVLARTTSLTTT